MCPLLECNSVPNQLELFEQIKAVNTRSERVPSCAPLVRPLLTAEYLRSQTSLIEKAAWFVNYSFMATTIARFQRKEHLSAVPFLCVLLILLGCTSRPAFAENELDAAVKKAAAQPSAPLDGSGWKPLFNGHSLAGWEVTEYGGHGPVTCQSGLILIEMGGTLSGINYTNGHLPTMDYELSLDAMKLSGSDFFCGLTFPIGATNCTLVLGGWGGTTVGISSIDSEDASENETAQYIKFDTNRWYRVRLRVTQKKIECWLDEKKIIDLRTTDKKIGMRFGEIEMSCPLGITTYQTSGAIRNIQLRRLPKDSK